MDFGFISFNRVQGQGGAMPSTHADWVRGRVLKPVTKGLLTGRPPLPGGRKCKIMGVFSLIRNLCSKPRITDDKLAIPLENLAVDQNHSEKAYTSDIHLQETQSMESQLMYSSGVAENRRKEERISTGGDVYVLTDTMPQILGQMVEISSGGLAFTFVDLDRASKGLDDRTCMNLDLFAHGRGHYVRSLPCRLISKIASNDPNFQIQTQIKRIGVSFENLSVAQQVQVNSLVRRHRDITAFYTQRHK